MIPPDQARVTVDQLLAMHAAAEVAVVGAIALALLLLALVAAAAAQASRAPRVSATFLALAGLAATQIPGGLSMPLGLAIAGLSLAGVVRGSGRPSVTSDAAGRAPLPAR